MDDRKPYGSRLHLFLYCLMVFSLSNTVAAALLLEFSGITRLLATAAGSLVVLAFLSKPFLFFATLGLGIVGGLLASYFLPARRLAFYEAAGAFLFNLLDHFRGREGILPENAPYLWVILMVFTALVSAVVLFHKKDNWPLLPFYGGFLLLYWYNYIDEAYSMMGLFLWVYLVSTGLKTYDWTERPRGRSHREEESHRYQQWQKTAIGYSLLIILLAAVFPKNVALVEWHWLENRMIRRFPVVTEMRDDLVYSRSLGRGEPYDFRFTGFQPDEAALGGPVLPNNRLVMTVQAPYPVYLRGNVKTRYADNAWYRDPAGNSARSPEGPFPREVIVGEEITLTITHAHFSTTTLFTPYQPLSVGISRGESLWMDHRYQLTFPDGVYRNETYTVRAVIPSVEKRGGSTGTPSPNNLQVPDTLPSRVGVLSAQITRGITDPLEKALALQDYLRETYAYETDVAYTPEGRDFIDYFLFDLRKGYCTYFASALAVMLRLEGIPARYVEGYLMANENREGLYEIRQNQAHAWVEAYVDGYGWITLEATPAYEVPEFLARTIGNEEAMISLTGDFDEFLLLVDSMETAREEAQSLKQMEEALGRRAEGVEGEIELSRRAGRAALIILLVLVMLLLGQALRQASRRRQFWKRLEQLESREQVILLYRNILVQLAVFGIPIEKGETPFEYARRISKPLFDTRNTFEELTEQYILAQYSRIGIGPEPVLLLREFIHYMEQRNRHQLGIRRYLIMKYMRGDGLTF